MNRPYSAFLNSPYVFWLLLCLPALPMLAELGGDDPKVYHHLLHPTGEFSARFMIVALAVTPLVLMFPGWRGPRWLMKRRRYLGVAAFGYAALHTVFYLIDKGSFGTVLAEAARAGIWTGWLAFLIFVPLAVTSTDGWVAALGPRWKMLQRWVYAAALFTLAHWLFVTHGPAAALVHATPLILLEGYRVWRVTQIRRRRAY